MHYPMPSDSIHDPLVWKPAYKVRLEACSAPSRALTDAATRGRPPRTGLECGGSSGRVCRWDRCRLSIRP